MTGKILVVDDSKLVTDIVAMRLAMYGYDVRLAHSGEEALARIAEDVPDLMVLDVQMPGIDGYEVCRELRRRPAFAQLPILMLTSHDTLAERLKGFEAGADHYLNKPVHPDELHVLVRSLLQRKAPETEQQPAQVAHTIAVYSLRGGVGVSTIAVNLAVGLAQLWGNRTTIVDLALATGQSALMLDLPLRRTWADLAPIANHELDADLLDMVLLRHASGVRVLASPPHPESNELLTGDKVTHVLQQLMATNTYLILDTPHDFAATTLAGLDAADHILLVLAPEMAAVHMASSALKVFESLDYPPDKVSLILNWTFARNGLARKEIEASLGHSVNLVIPFVPEPLVTAINTGVPPVFGTPKLPVGALFEDFAFRLSTPEHRSRRPEKPRPAWLRVAQRAQQQQQHQR